MPRSAAASGHNRPRRSTQLDLPTVSLAGSILWLPPNDEVGDLGLEGGCYEHPVVVLSSKAQDGRVDILIITSFGGRDLVHKFPRPSELRKTHLPIKPSSAHPDHGVLLVLANHRQELSKRSYVKTHNVLKVPLMALRPYNKKSKRDYCLSKESFSTLLVYCAFVPPTGLSPSSEERAAVRIIPQDVAIFDQPQSHRQVFDTGAAQLLVQAMVSSNASKTPSQPNVSPPIHHSQPNRGYGAIPSRRYNPPGAYPPQTPRNYYQSTTDPFTYDTTPEPNELRHCLWMLAKVLFTSAVIGGLGYGLHLAYGAVKLVKIGKVNSLSLKSIVGKSLGTAQLVWRVLEWTLKPWGFNLMN